MDQDPQEPLGPPELPRGAKFTPLSTVRPKMPQSESDEEDEDRLNEHVLYPADPDGVLAAEERRKRQTERSAPVQQKTELIKKPRKRRWPIILVVIVLIAGATYGAYWFGSNQASKKTPVATSATQHSETSVQQQSAPQKQTPAVPTKHYDSTTYTLGFDYPETWSVSDTAAKLTVVSPAVSLTTVDGSTVNGHVVVTIQNQQTTLSGYPTGGAVAVSESDKITYKQPTPVQRAQTYLSYLGYGTKPGGLDALYVTGDNGYQKDQNIPMSDIVKGNPLISVTFQSCTSADCSSGTPTMLTLNTSTWLATTESKQITDFIQSIQLN